MCPPTTVSADLVVACKDGLHARPAAVFVRRAARYSSHIYIQNLSRDSPPQNAKSLVSVLSAAIDRGHRVRLIASGTDAEDAVAVLSDLIGSDHWEVEESHHATS